MTCTLKKNPEDYCDGYQDNVVNAGVLAFLAETYRDNPERLGRIMGIACDYDIDIEENPMIGWQYDFITKEKAYDIYAYQCA